jgi:integrase
MEVQMAKKRGQGEGSIYQRKDKRWVGQVTITGEKISKYFKSQREARMWVNETTSRVDDGLTLMGAKTTLEEYLKEWLVTAQTSVRPKTYEQYSQIVRQHIIPVLGRTKLKDLTPGMIQSLYNMKLRKGTSERTVVLIHAVIHRSLNQAMKLGVLGRNPADGVTKPRMKKQEMKVLDENQVMTFLNTAKGTRFELLFYMAVTTGLRQGELLGLKWSDLDWNRGELSIQRQAQRISGEGIVFSEPKSSSGKRSIRLGKTTIEKLRSHLNQQQLEREVMGDIWVGHDLIFPSTIGTPMGRSNLWQIFKDLLKKAGLDDMRFHDLRHSAASLMLKEGIHPKVVQEQLGHSDISLTLNIYSHVIPSMKQEVGDKMDELLTPHEIGRELRQFAQQ